MRSWRSELLSLLLVLTVPAVVALVFPYPALRFQARKPLMKSIGFSAFVMLTAEEENEAIKAAKTSWRGEGGVSDQVRTELLLGELPAPDSSPVLTIESRNRPLFGRHSDRRLPVYLPSQAAPLPKKLTDDGVEEAKPAFSRQDLLKIY